MVLSSVIPIRALEKTAGRGPGCKSRAPPPTCSQPTWSLATRRGISPWGLIAGEQAFALQGPHERGSVGIHPIFCWARIRMYILSCPLRFFNQPRKRGDIKGYDDDDDTGGAADLLLDC